MSAILIKQTVLEADFAGFVRALIDGDEYDARFDG